ncbi:hypothetical protein KKF38_00385 [Patescibacteria group bacterium]|nr:hypothetical protein [Patescibacteria group bacterium]
MSKTKTISRKPRRLIKFTVRRIANKNPRNARVFHQFKQKLSRATAGLLAFGLLVSGVFLGEGDSLKSEIIQNENSACAATEIAANFEDLTSRLANLSRSFPQLIENLDFCAEADCAAEKKLRETEDQIWQLEDEITELKKDEKIAREEFEAELANLEDEALFCENEQRCEVTEADLRIAQSCEKEFRTIARMLETQEDVEKDYSLADSKGREYPAAILVKKLIEEVSKNRTRDDENSDAYERCVTVSDESVCQKYAEKAEAAQQKETAAIEELGGLKSDLEIAIEELNADIVALEIGKKDSANLEPEEGKGWCENELEEKGADLNKKMNAAANLKKAYDAALAELKTKKATLKEVVAAELAEIEMHAAAEREAEEMRITAEREAEEQRAKAEILFGIWSLIRNTF